MNQSRGIFVAVAVSALVVAVCSSRGAQAHETQSVGPKGDYLVVVGWREEPAFTNVVNAAAVIIRRASDGRPIDTSAGDVVDLEAEIQFRSGSPKERLNSKLLDSLPLGKVKLEAYKDNQYIAWVLPRTAGVYAFRFKGTIEDKSDPKAGPVAVDVTIICGENAPGRHDHFACVKDPLVFPSKETAATVGETHHQEEPSPSQGQQHEHSPLRNHRN